MTKQKKKPFDILSFGTIYLDIDFISFPFKNGLFARKEVVGKEYELEVGGSAFNFAKICAQVGLKPYFIGQVGQDEIASAVQAISKKNTTMQLHLIKNENVKTNVAVHYVKDDGVSIMTSAGTANQALSPDDVKKVLQERLDQVEYLYLGGGFKLVEMLSAYDEIVSMATEAGVKVVLDHGRVNNAVTNEQAETMKSIISKVDFYVPSKDEFLQLWNGDSIVDSIPKVKKVMKKGSVLVVKDSENGCFSSDDNAVFRVPAVPLTPVNTIGAGDSFNAGFISAFCAGNKLKRAMELACCTAALKITDRMLSQQNITEVHTQSYT